MKQNIIIFIVTILGVIVAKMYAGTNGLWGFLVGSLFFLIPYLYCKLTIVAYQGKFDLIVDKFSKFKKEN